MNDRRKRVERIKRIIILIAAVSVSVLFIFCIVLAIRLNNLEEQVQALKNERHKSLEIVWNEENEVVREEKIEEKIEETQQTETEQEKEKVQTGVEVQEENSDLRKVYLTFDDGPSMYTGEILDILKKYNVKATFFVTGASSSRYPEQLQEILDDGHTLAIHSYSHVYQDMYSSLEAFQADFYRIRDFIYECTGEDIKIYRFPGGSANTVLLKDTRRKIFEWLRQEEIIYFDWNVSSGDAAGNDVPAEQIVQNCIDGVQRQKEVAIVLLHDGNGKKSTVEALPFIIEGINRLDDTILLPIDRETVTIQQRYLTKE